MHKNRTFFISEMLRTKAIQKWLKICKTNPFQSKVCRAWRWV